MSGNLEHNPGIDFITLLQNPAANAVAADALGKLIEASAAGQIFVLFDTDGQPKQAWLNSSASKLLGETSATLLSRPEAERWTRFLHPSDVLAYLADDAELLRTGGQAQHTFRILDPNSRNLVEGSSNYLWIAEERNVILDPATNRAAGSLAILQDVTRMGVFAYQDALTGLHNRNYLEEYWSGEYNRIQRVAESRRSSLGFLLCDLDHLKNVNDAVGHLEGDRAIIEAADFLKREIRQYDLAIRWGGDEFFVLAPNTTRENTTKLAERLHDKFKAAELRFGGFSLTMSIGYHHINLGKMDLTAKEALDLFFKRTDVALYEAKAAGRDCIREYR